MTVETQKVKFRRRHYLISKKFQLKYVGLILALIFLTAALCSYVVYYTAMLMMGEKLANVYPQGRLVSIVNAVNFRILLSVILITPLIAVIGIFLSHRIAGPLFRIERFLNDMTQGDLSSILTLRRNDELHTLADSINNMTGSLKRNIANQKLCVEKIKSEVAALRAAASKAPDTTAFTETLARIETVTEDLHAEISRFKT